ncbi:hypothetical protein, partial [Klebsiella variicola]|uniref:hypothetical protein n=1 Tax=Klebsiella variicola TaxID=244366 RepID=UPI000D89D1F9
YSAIDQIAQFGLSSLKVIYYSEQLFSIFSESKGKPKARAKAPERERLKQRQGNRTPRPTIQPAEHNRRFLEEQRERNAEYTKKLIEQTEADIKASEKFFLED